jgi:hypothetical protein
VIQVSAGPLVATLWPEVGGRIRSLTVDGVELLWSDPERRGGEKAPFPLPGGDKVWLGPQASWPDERPYAALDLEPWTYEDGEMRSPLEPTLEISLARRVYADGHALVVETEMVGAPRGDVWLWEVTQFLLPATARFPGEEVRLGSEGRESDAEHRSAAGVTEVRTRGGGPWKLSSNGPVEWVEAEVNGVTLRRTLVGRHGLGQVYDSEDNGYWELELHSPLGAAVHRERWSVPGWGQRQGG